jgi:hypothetical protein
LLHDVFELAVNDDAVEFLEGGQIVQAQRDERFDCAMVVLEEALREGWVID